MARVLVSVTTNGHQIKEGDLLYPLVPCPLKSSQGLASDGPSKSSSFQSCKDNYYSDLISTPYILQEYRICLEGKSMTPCHYSLPFLQQLPSVGLGPLKGFLADTAPFKGPQPRRVRCFGSTEKQGDCQVCRARRGGPRTASRTTDAILDCAFIANAVLHTNP